MFTGERVYILERSLRGQVFEVISSKRYVVRMVNNRGITVEYPYDRVVSSTMFDFTGEEDLINYLPPIRRPLYNKIKNLFVMSLYHNILVIQRQPFFAPNRFWTGSLFLSEYGKIDFDLYKG